MTWLGTRRGEAKDDLLDGWESKKTDRDWVLKLLLRARIDRDVKPIFLSGDYHKTAASEIWYYEEKSGINAAHVFGYEILATGLYHEGIAHGIKARAFRRVEAQRVGGHTIRLDSGETRYRLEPYVKRSAVAPNFASLTLDGPSVVARIYFPEEDVSFSEWVASEYSLRLDFSKNYRATVETTGALSFAHKVKAVLMKGTLINVRPLERTAVYPLGVPLLGDEEAKP